MTSLDPSIARSAERNPSPTAAVGAPGTAIFGGYIVTNEKDRRLVGLEKYRTFSNVLANTSIVAAGVRFFLNLVSRAGWKVIPADDSEEAETIAELIEEIRNDMVTPWHRIVRRAAMFRFYGFSIQEWTAKKREDGAVGLLDVESRPQRTIERWDTDRTGTVLGCLQTDPQTQQELYLPRGKIVYLVDDSLDDSPEGVGLFRHLVAKAATLERYELLEGWGFERDLRGVPIGRGPLSELQKLVESGNLTQEQVTELRAPIETFVRNALKGKETGLVLDSAVWRGSGEQQTPISEKQWSIELLQGGTTSQPDMAKAIERLNREMARVLGVEQLLLGSDSTGSFALSRDKTQSFGLTVSSTLQEISEAFTRDLIGPLMDLNGWDRKLMPYFQVEQIQYRDIEQVTTALRDMATAGATLMPNDPAINEVRAILGLSPAPEMDEAMVEAFQNTSLGLNPDGSNPKEEKPADGEPKKEPVEKRRKSHKRNRRKR